MKAPSLSYEQWLAQLRELARAQELEWVVSGEPMGHREAYERGLSPDDELAALKDLSEWRGCGCGGGG